MKLWKMYAPPASAASDRPTRLINPNSPVSRGSVIAAAAYIEPTAVLPESVAEAVFDQRSLFKMWGKTTSCITSDTMLPTAQAPPANVLKGTLVPPGITKSVEG